MKKRLSALALGAIIVTSCGGGSGGGTPNGNSGNGYYLRVTIAGGATLDFPQSLGFEADSATVGTTTNRFSLYGMGKDAKSASPFPALSIDINRPAVIQLGQPYTLPGDYSLQATYNFDGFDRYEAVHVDPANFSITLDSINSTEVKGHFGGQMKRTTDNSIINVTGSFYVPFKKK